MPAGKIKKTEPEPRPEMEALAFLTSAAVGMMQIIRRNNTPYVILSDCDPEFVLCENRLNLALASAEKELKTDRATSGVKNPRKGERRGR